MKQLTSIFVILLVLFGCTNGAKTEAFMISLSGGDVDVENFGQFASDSLALEAASARVLTLQERATRNLESLLKETPTSPTETLTHDLKIEAYQNVLNAQRTLVCFKHSSKIEAEDFIGFVSMYGIDSEETRKFIKDYEMEVNLYPLQ